MYLQVVQTSLSTEKNAVITENTVSQMIFPRMWKKKVLTISMLQLSIFRSLTECVTRHSGPPLTVSIFLGSHNSTWFYLLAENKCHSNNLEFIHQQVDLKFVFWTVIYLWLYDFSIRMSAIPRFQLCCYVQKIGDWFCIYGAWCKSQRSLYIIHIYTSRMARCWHS